MLLADADGGANSFLSARRLRMQAMDPRARSQSPKSLQLIFSEAVVDDQGVFDGNFDDV